MWTLMMICFLSPMDAEAQHLLDSSDLLHEEQLGFAKVYKLSFSGIVFYVCVGGIGKVLSSAAVTACILAHPEVDAFINIGIGGSLDAEKAPLLSAVIGEKFCQHDMDTTAFGDPKSYLNGLGIVDIPADLGLNIKIQHACQALSIPCTKGVIASGDQGIADENKKREIAEYYGALLIDMEAAAFAEVCYVYDKPFGCLRIVSDAVDHSAEYLENKYPAGKKACEVALEILKQAA